MEAIFKRRSVRAFQKDKKISKTLLDTLLNAAMMSPTGMNLQEWEFLVIQSPAVIKSLMTVHPHAAALETAPCVILVCANMDINHAQRFWVGDCGAATQTILLAARDLGLGTLWMGVECAPDRAEALSKLLKLPANIKPFALIAVGYPVNEMQTANSRFNEKKVHYDKWTWE